MGAARARHAMCESALKCSQCGKRRYGICYSKRLLQYGTPMWNTQHARTHCGLLLCFIISVNVKSKVRVCAARVSGVHIFSLRFICYVYVKANLEYLTTRIGGDSSNLEGMDDSKGRFTYSMPCPCRSPAMPCL